MKVDLTPAKLADIKQKAEGCDPKYWVMDQHGDVMAVDFDSEGTQPKIASVEFLEDAEFIAAADPATVLALIARIRQLEEQVAVLSKIERDRWLQAAKALGIKPRNLGHGN